MNIALIHYGCNHSANELRTGGLMGISRYFNSTSRILHIDIVGALPPLKGYSYLLTCIGCFTC